ncbi:hypothetical protein GCM10008931_00770 [Oceanobacillus oncorhynchi subsp. oncorhynchi]
MGSFFIFLVGFGMTVTGSVTIIAYFNFLPAGLTWADYFTFIAGRLECYFLPLGLLLILISLRHFSVEK